MNFEQPQGKKYVEIPQGDEISRIDFDDLLKKYNEARDAVRLTDEEVYTLIAKLKFLAEGIANEKFDLLESELFDLGKRIANRAKKETGVDWSAIQKEATPFILKGEQDPKKEKRLKKGEEGLFVHHLGAIYISKSTDNLIVNLAMLATLGNFIKMQTIHHELIHTKQGGTIEEARKKITLGILNAVGAFSSVVIYLAGLPMLGAGLISALAVKKMVSLPKEYEKVILDETHAYIGSSEYGKDSKNHNLSAFINTIHQQQYKIPKRYQEKIIESYLATQRLYALGLNDSEIGELVKIAEWNKQKKCFPQLTDKISERMEVLKLDELDLEDLVTARSIKLWTERFIIQKIAQEEIKKSVKVLAKYYQGTS